MIKRADINDAGMLAGLAVQLWEDKDPAALADEFRELMKRDDAVCFIKYADGSPIAFAQ